MVRFGENSLSLHPARLSKSSRFESFSAHPFGSEGTGRRALMALLDALYGLLVLYKLFEEIRELVPVAYKDGLLILWR